MDGFAGGWMDVKGWMWKDGCEKMRAGASLADDLNGSFWGCLKILSRTTRNDSEDIGSKIVVSKKIFSIIFSWEMNHLWGEYEVLIVICTWWDHNMHHIKACNDGKWHVSGDKHKTERVTCTIRNAKLQLDLLFLPTCTTAMHMLFVFWDYYDYMYLTHSRERSGGDSSLWPTRFKVWWWQQCWSLEHQTNKRLDKWL